MSYLDDAVYWTFFFFCVTAHISSLRSWQVTVLNLAGLLEVPRTPNERGKTCWVTSHRKWYYSTISKMHRTVSATWYIVHISSNFGLENMPFCGWLSGCFPEWSWYGGWRWEVWTELFVLIALSFDKHRSELQHSNFSQGQRCSK